MRPEQALESGAAAADAAGLFALAERSFPDLFAIEQLVAASDERALFLVQDRVLKRRVALRIHLKPDAPSRRWFERESELLASLDHPAIRPVYSAGTRDTVAWRVSKWIDGESLHDAVARGPRPIPTVAQIARDLTTALEYAHAKRVVLRRILPTTLMLDRADQAVITDLRYANLCLDVAVLPDEPSSDPFLAPEARRARPGEPGSDIYTAGALLYYAVTGVEPEVDPARIRRPRELRPTCPQAIERVILRALQPEPSDRYLTAAEMADDLASDLGEFDTASSVAPPIPAVTEDARAWEKRLRRALGDEYELLDELGRGGFGRVYRVRDLRLEREVALKILHPYLTADPAVVDRFRREAQLAARLDHQNIVQIFDVGGRAGLQWYIMEYVPGESLAQMVQRDGTLTLDRAVRLLLESLDALQHAHRQGLVHRDLKPENLLIDRADGAVRISDFGLALAFRGPDRFGGASASRSGTPEFASPEQLLGEPVDHRSDLYSLTLVIYFALAGKSPFTGGTVQSIIARQASGVLPDLETQRSDVPEQLLLALQEGAEPRAADRFASAEHYARAVRGAMRRARPLQWLKSLLER
ncbi:MAG: serine/threonine protein kinase [Gemmatimonadetes bacterium]|nr:serine/threonine protein kinase [Gemmatimonadota bacterium]